MDPVYQSALQAMLEYSEQALNVPDEDRQRIGQALGGQAEAKELFREFVRDAGLHQNFLVHVAEAAVEGRHPHEGCVWPDCAAKHFPYSRSPAGPGSQTPSTQRLEDEKAQR